MEDQLSLVCEQCDGQRVIRSDDTSDEVCDWCDGTGIEPDAWQEPLANLIDAAALALVELQQRRTT